MVCRLFKVADIIGDTKCTEYISSLNFVAVPLDSREEVFAAFRDSAQLKWQQLKISNKYKDRREIIIPYDFQEMWFFFYL